ncbi:hypothetical protein CYMTET_35940, partial [Cymbomonas tetramitiformis]
RRGRVLVWRRCGHYLAPLQLHHTPTSRSRGRFHQQREPSKTFCMANSMKTLPVAAVSTDMWVIEVDGKGWAGSRLHAGKLFRLRHLTTGLYLKTPGDQRPAQRVMKAAPKLADILAEALVDVEDVEASARPRAVTQASAMNTTCYYDEPATLWSIANDRPGSVVEKSSLVYCASSSNPGAAVMLTCNCASLNGDTRDDGAVSFSKVHRLDNMLAFHRVDPLWANQVYRFMHIYQHMNIAAKRLQKGVRAAVFRGRHTSPNRCRVGNRSVAHSLDVHSTPRLRWELVTCNIIAGIKAGHYTNSISAGVGLSVRTALKAHAGRWVA